MNFIVLQMSCYLKCSVTLPNGAVVGLQLVIVLFPDHTRLLFKPPPPLVGKAAVCSRAVVLSLLIYCLMYFLLFVGVLCLSLFCYALLSVLSSFAITLKRKRDLVALLLLSYGCLVTVNIL